MKQILTLFMIIAAMLVLAACAAPPVLPSGDAPLVSAAPAISPVVNEASGMKVTSAGIVNGVIDPKYGKYGQMQNNVPVLSLPLEISGAPAGTKAYAIYMEDPDAKPLAGYSWVHWMAVNITTPAIPEGYSQSAGDTAVQGKNDFGAAGYGGPTPPDKDHRYVIRVYALDGPVDLKKGFGKDAFLPALQGHVLAGAALEAVYKK